MRLDYHAEKRLKSAMRDALYFYQNKRHTRRNDAMEQSAANCAIRFFNDWLQQKKGQGDE